MKENVSFGAGAMSAEKETVDRGKRGEREKKKRRTSFEAERGMDTSKKLMDRKTRKWKERDTR